MTYLRTTVQSPPWSCGPLSLPLKFTTLRKMRPLRPWVGCRIIFTSSNNKSTHLCLLGEQENPFSPSLSADQQVAVSISPPRLLLTQYRVDDIHVEWVAQWYQSWKVRLKNCIETDAGTPWVPGYLDMWHCLRNVFRWLSGEGEKCQTSWTVDHVSPSC